MFLFCSMATPADTAEDSALKILQEMRDLATEFSNENSSFAHRAHDLLNRIRYPDMAGVSDQMGYRVIACEVGTATQVRTIAACSNSSVALAAWEAACRVYPDYRWLLCWGAMVSRDSKPLKPGD
jgi:hypothetical protein